VETWVPLIREFGLPLAFLVAFFWALSTRRLVLGSELERKQALLQAEADYRERLRAEERAARAAAEERLAKLTAQLPKLAEAIAVRERDLERIMDASRDDREAFDKLVRGFGDLRESFDLLARDLRG
jgi:hypothetical protein